MKRRFPSARLLVLVGPTCVAGAAVLVAACVSFGLNFPGWSTSVGIAALLVASAFAERFPVPLEGLDAGGVSLSFVFGVAALLLFGWAPGVIVCFVPAALTQLLDRRPLLRVAYNASTFSLAALATGSVLALLSGTESGALVARAGVAGGVQYSVNVLLVATVVAVNSRRSLAETIRSSVRGTALPFMLMTSTALVLAVLWERSPYFSAPLIGPLLALGLYQRSNYQALRAIRLSLTDPLTGLGNHRHFHETLARELVQAREAGRPVTLCLLDVDDFKNVNDRFGHPAGDRVLVAVAGQLRQGGETFRLGGDEFAVLLPGRDEADGLATATTIADRISRLPMNVGGRVSVSVGVASSTQQAAGDELIRLADEALYRAKAFGKNQVSAPPVRQLDPDAVAALA
jgi:diguanylate cyclase (GGDEF)-like protein